VVKAFSREEKEAATGDESVGERILPAMRRMDGGGEETEAPVPRLGGSGNSKKRQPSSEMRYEAKNDCSSGWSGDRKPPLF
jgi:hypothetical protein